MQTNGKSSAVIFDCDGVMFDSRQANNDFYNHLLARFQLPPMSAAQEEFAHMRTTVESVDLLFRHSAHREAAQRLRATLDYSPFLSSMILDPDLKPLLERLKPRFGLGVATNRTNTIGEVLTHHGLRAYFDIVVSALDVRSPKPDPEPLLKILAHFGLAPRQALYVGDTAVDAQTALAADVPFVAFRNRELPAQYHVQHLLEIAPIAEERLHSSG